jgi:hypothetical protein
MKTINLKTVVAGLLAIIVCNSCSKEKDAVSHNTMLLIEKGWRFDFYGLDENNNGVIDESESAVQSCELDDIFTFNTNGTGSLAHGSTACSVGEPATVNFNWTFSNNETELAIFSAPEKISILNETTLEVYYMDQNLQGESVKYIRRFKH